MNIKFDNWCLKYSTITAISTNCGSKYRITLGGVGTNYQSETAGVYKQVCTASDGTAIYKLEDENIYLYFVDIQGSPFWVVSNRIGGNSLIVKGVNGDSPGCVGPESEGYWLIITGPVRTYFEYFLW